MILLGAVALVCGCGGEPKQTQRSVQADEAMVEAPINPPVTIYVASKIVTMDKASPAGEAVAVSDGMILGVGSLDQLTGDFPAAIIDTGFSDQILIPGLIDPHVHMILGAMQYALPFVPPWEMATPQGIVEGLPDRAAFLARVAELEAETTDEAPLIVYGYHNLVHGDLTRQNLDAISSDRPIVVWHYSSHDFYLNTKALEWTKVDASLAEKFAGVPLDEDGFPTGRIIEDASIHVFTALAPILMSPAHIEKGFNGFETMLARSGVTAVAELGYGIFNRPLEDIFIAANYDEHSTYRLFLVPEHRAFTREFGEGAPAKILEMVENTADKPVVVLPQIKLFTDAAFYSQTMRLLEPGYTGGQSKGTLGLWVTEPDDLADVMRPYWEAGLDIRIHSNGDAAQKSTLAAFSTIKQEHPDTDQNLTLEHAGIIRPEEIEQLASLDVGVSAASHYVFYMGEDYRSAIGDLVDYMTPLASVTKAGAPVTLHSDAPLAPPNPLRAAAVHMLRATRQGGVSTPTESLSAYEALEAVTLDAAWAMGLDDEIGSITVGKRADFTVLDKNPLESAAEEWTDIKIWGVVLGGEKRPVQ